MSDVFKPMRSCTINEANLTFPKYGSHKLDGIRMCKFEGKTRTKSGKPVPNKFIREWVEQNLAEGLDCEIGVGDPTAPDFYTKTYSGVMSHEGEPDFKLYVFDICDNLKDYTQERLLQLFRRVASMSMQAQERVVIVHQTMLHSLEEFVTFYEMALEQGYEGVILRNPTGLYKYGKCTPTSQDQTKHKPEEDYDAEIVSAYEAETNLNEAFTNEVGETKRSTHAENKEGKGMLGGFLCREPGRDNTFKVGAGKLSHKERETLWKAYQEDQSSLNGKFLKYRCLNYGQMANNRPRHGRWIGWRSPIDMEPFMGAA